MRKLDEGLVTVMKSRWIQAIATFGGIGKIPKAPGTYASLATIPVALFLQLGGDVFYMVTTLLITAGSIWVAEAYEKHFQVHDPKEVVIDEVVGMLIALFLVTTWSGVIAAFLLFRVFDILKPPPVGWADQNVKGGFGVIADDIFAGIMASIGVQVIYSYTHWLTLF